MTKLLLTSQGMNIQEEIIKILPQSPNKLKIAYIITASTPEKDKKYISNDRQSLIDLGFCIEDVDICGKNEQELRSMLQDKDIVFVQGGATFYLLKQAKLSGFDNAVRELVAQGKIYIGISAGSSIACPTIESSTWKRKDRNHFGLLDLDALNLVPFLISNHFKESERTLIENGVISTTYPVVALHDTQAVLVIDGKWKIVGEGKREFYNGFKETLI
jgi:dipeptidase E